MLLNSKTIFNRIVWKSDQNLAKFENYFNISISYRGNKLEISGDQESSLMAADKIMELYNE